MAQTVTVKPLENDNILLNPGMGILFVLRGAQHVRYDQIDPDAWFLKEKISDKIEVSIPWCLLEPKEGEFNWEHPQWEGSFKSWVDKGFKVGLKVRGMSTRGTLYDDGTPQWVFDAGAKYIDENMDAYVNLPVPKRRVPVYWDPVYLEKTKNLIKALGERYNGKPFVEFVQIAHMGQWGEMHVSMHTPVQPWLDAGYCPEKYLEAHKKIIDWYSTAFPDTQLSQALGPPIFSASELSDVEKIIPYLANKKIMFKYGGLGFNWESKEGDPFVDESIQKYYNSYYPFTKMYMENLGSLQAMKSGLKCHISYWHRGGEVTGLGMPYKSDSVSAGIYKYMAKNIGYRFVLQEICYPETIKTGEAFNINYTWKNTGCAPCYDNCGIVCALIAENGQILWEEILRPSQPISSPVWNSGCRVVDSLSWIVRNISSGTYYLAVGMRSGKNPGQKIELAINGGDEHRLYRVGKITVIEGKNNE